MTQNRKFPIKDIQYHEEQIREIASPEVSIEEGKALAWHSTALAYLHFGAAKGFDCPAAEREVDGKIEAAAIEDYLIPATDSHGLTFFKHVFKQDK